MNIYGTLVSGHYMVISHQLHPIGFSVPYGAFTMNEVLFLYPEVRNLYQIEIYAFNQDSLKIIFQQIALSHEFILY